ncbi:Hypothetical_protein [Hexamita inflata]|uniref:Hypothetical_protein n=1 Tax=Hexamita inflata TaxID=28002 RepID=A0AA86QPL0_9EUKA|nr:Hypothetical protein HINF_LOCUS49513 [Hexamita inflata]
MTAVRTARCLLSTTAQKCQRSRLLFKTALLQTQMNLFRLICQVGVSICLSECICSLTDMASKLLSCQYHKSKLICNCWCGTARKYLFARDLLLPLQLLLCSLLSTLFRDCQNKLLHSLLIIDTVQNCIRRSQRKTCLD